MICNCHAKRGGVRCEKEGLGIRKCMYETSEAQRTSAVMRMGKVSVAAAGMEMPAVTNSHTVPTADHASS